MHFIARVLIGLNALIHAYIAWFEMTAWSTAGPDVFPSLPAVLFEQGGAMAANQGLYNSFLSAGLIWSLFVKEVTWQKRIATCFLVFIAIAGIFGVFTVSLTTLYAQFLPASLAMASVWGLKAEA